MRPSCTHCATPMRKRRKMETSGAGCAAVAIAATLGVLLTATGAGAIIGIPAIILAAIMAPMVARRARPIWRCPACRAYFYRG